MYNCAPRRLALSPLRLRGWVFTGCTTATLLFQGPAAYAQAIPPSEPTRLGTAATASVHPGRPPANANYLAPSKPAEVLVSGSGSNLEIRADNSSLNGILRRIADQTGVRITGGVIDQRVFGTYGPGPANQVLTQLLEGTGTNIMVREDSDGKLGEVDLSPRLGGPTPPGPSSFHEDALPPQVSVTPGQSAPTQQQLTRPLVPTQSFATPPATPGVTDAARPSVTPDPQGISDPPMATSMTPTHAVAPSGTPSGATDSSSGGTSPSSSNAPKTPQQIYEELQRLQQQQDKSQHQ